MILVELRNGYVYVFKLTIPFLGRVIDAQREACLSN